MVVSEVQAKGFDMGYQFFKVGQDPYSPALKSDVVALLYVGLLESEPRYKKLVVSSASWRGLPSSQSLSWRPSLSSWP